jgi:hypothetical protein
MRLVFSRETELESFQLKDFSDFMVLRYVSRDLDRHPETYSCLHKIEHDQLDRVIAQFGDFERASLSQFLEDADSTVLAQFHLTLANYSVPEEERGVNNFTKENQSQIIVENALAKGPFESEVMLLLTDEWTVANKGVSWTLERVTRHILDGKVITTFSRYFAPAKSVQHLGTAFGWLLRLGYRVAIRDDSQKTILSVFQEFCTRVDFSIRHHNDHDPHSWMKFGIRIYMTTNGITLQTNEQPSRKYRLDGKHNLGHFKNIAGQSRVEQIWTLSKFQATSWSAISHLALIAGKPESLKFEEILVIHSRLPRLW